jgi:SAM-dependent methyltransferase
LALESVSCCLCGSLEADPIAVGEDFEYRTSPDSFLALRCRRCDLVYLDPRPSASELPRIYPDTYHAFAFSDQGFGLVSKVRKRVDAARLLRQCRHLGAQARIIDVGCGDGFHLGLLREFGRPSWQLEGVDLDGRAVATARARGLTVHEGTVENLDLERSSYDLAFMIQTIEHVADPPTALAATRELLRPGGRVVVVTDNTGSLDYRLFRRRHWGGYHFPRHWNLFNRSSMTRLAVASGLEVERIETIVSPVNWVYSVRNAFDDLGAPRGLVEQFSLVKPVSLAAFTVFDAVQTLLGRGALLRAVLRRPQ